jgi:2-methylisocitrate lyase-like PEP mutase family enzyme
MPSTSDKRQAFRRLHEAGCFVMPNPWDIGGVKHLQQLGFEALATTSAGYAWSRGLADGQVSLDAMLAHVAELAGAADCPLNADFEAGYADTPDGVGVNVRFCVETGVAGLSIEDYSGDKAIGLYDIETAVARLRAARAAIDAAGGETLLTGRSEGFIRGKPDMEETIRRLRAYGEAGADCLYAPGLTSRAQIAAVVGAVAPKPVNILMGGPSDLKLADLAALGVRRISLGGALARAAWGGFLRTARDIRETGSFNSLADAAPGPAIVKPFL